MQIFSCFILYDYRLLKFSQFHENKFSFFWIDRYIDVAIYYTEYLIILFAKKIMEKKEQYKPNNKYTINKSVYKRDLINSLHVCLSCTYLLLAMSLK